MAAFLARVLVTDGKPTRFLAQVHSLNLLNLMGRAFPFIGQSYKNTNNILRSNHYSPDQLVMRLKIQSLRDLRPFSKAK
jgi:hypothetical protein